MKRFKYIKSIMLYGYRLNTPLWKEELDKATGIYRNTYLQCLTAKHHAHWDRPWLMEAATWTRKIK